MSDVNQQLNLTFNILNTSAQWMLTFETVVREVLQYFDRDPAAKALTKAFDKGAKPMFTFCSDQREAADMALKLDEAGVLYFRGTYGEKPIFVYADTQRDLVKEATAEFRMMHEHGGIVPKSVLAAAAKGNMHVIKGLDLHQAMLFEEYCKENKVNIAIDGPEHEKYRVYYTRPDTVKMEEVKRQVALSLCGRTGDIVRGQLDYENQNYIRIHDKVQDQKQDRFFIVDLDGQTIKSGKYDVQFTNMNGFVNKVSRRDPEFDQKVNYMLSSMREMADLDEEQYENYQDLISEKSDVPEASRRFEFLRKIHLEHGRPELTREDLQILKKEQDERALYEAKLAQENPEQKKYQYSYTNSEMRMAQFLEFERINEEDVHDTRESFQANPVYLSSLESVYEGMGDEPDNGYAAEDFGNQLLDGTFSSSEFGFDSKAFDQEMEDFRNKNMRDEMSGWGDQ